MFADVLRRVKWETLGGSQTHPWYMAQLSDPKPFENGEGEGKGEGEGETKP